MTNAKLPAEVSELRRAVVVAATPQERARLDFMLASAQKLAKKLKLDKEKQDELGELRIINANEHAGLVADLRKDGRIREGRPRKLASVKTVSIDEIGGRMLVQMADEIRGWPDKKRDAFIAEIKRKDEEVLTLSAAYREAKNYRLDKLRREAEVTGELSDDVLLFNAPFQDVLPKLDPEMASMVFTDPPYDEASILLYRDLAELARPVMAEGASLMAYFGHYAAPKIMALMGDHLRFWWLIAVDHTGGRRELIGKDVRVHWKPIVWYVKNGRYNNEFVDDLVVSEPPSKDLHEWEQSCVEAEYYIGLLSEPGGWILDPMMGSGTTGIAALSAGRRFIGIEKDPQRYAVAHQRIREWQEKSPRTIRTTNP